MPLGRRHNVPPAGTHGPARRPSPPMPCGSPPAELVISSNPGGFQPRAARPGSLEDSHSLLDHLIGPLQERRGIVRPRTLSMGSAQIKSRSGPPRPATSERLIAEVDQEYAHDQASDADADR